MKQSYINRMKAADGATGGIIGGIKCRGGESLNAVITRSGIACLIFWYILSGISRQEYRVKNETSCGLVPASLNTM